MGEGFAFTWLSGGMESVAVTPGIDDRDVLRRVFHCVGVH
jgi:hypothetical protein